MKLAKTLAFAALSFSGALFAAEPASAKKEAAPAALPKLVELGASSCVPCKRMKPIIDELTREQAGVIAVEFIDVKKDAESAKPYKVRIIPCQVFLDASGKERFRHEGFWSKKDITAKWLELGVTLKPAPAAPAAKSADAKSAAPVEPALPAGTTCAPTPAK